MIQAIVFDIGNVLTDFCWREVIDSLALSEEEKEVLRTRIFTTWLWEEYDRGVMGDEAVTAALRANCAGYEKAFDTLYEHFSELVRERAYSAPLIKKLKTAGYRVFVLSNYGKTMYESNAINFSFMKLLDGGILSYREKLIKPDPRIYQLIEERFGETLSDCLFLDDRADNVEAARKTGMKAEVAFSKESIEDALKKHGIF